MQTLKYHCIACLLGCNLDFPWNLWDRLITQAEATLYILQQSQLHPQLSAHDAINGTFDFNKTLLVPSWTQVVAHEKPSKRKTFDPLGIDDSTLSQNPITTNVVMCMCPKREVHERVTQWVPSHMNSNYNQKLIRNLAKTNYTKQYASTNSANSQKKNKEKMTIQ